ncbi:hypothetical protein [Bacillus pseudomycoides]|uniref:hypothetical protein n=1 Tax=Bacillus pseudomycoides TaxID=64104 RepID=UPI000BF1C7B5|nr:hypothetical protein [Bacillus pseudomycoides]PEN08661.1 hypothetical protein CN640_13310 [Bacillus pseudomycoides]PFZ93753.1 hypothetical protein COL70_08855 [Bacillus pseudomycoides]
MNLEEFFLKWVNHTKEGDRRSNLDKTDEYWKQVLQDIRNWENSEDKDANELAKSLLYTGKIRRVHVDLNEVDYDNHYVSWTLAENLKDLYWFYPSYSHTIITAEATKDNPAISFIGYIEAVKKIEGIDIVTPAIKKEQEVIFPLEKESILSVERIKIK